MFVKRIKEVEAIVFPSASDALKISQAYLKEKQEKDFETNKLFILKEINKEIERGETSCFVHIRYVDKMIQSFLKEKGYEVNFKYLNSPMSNFCVVSWYKGEIEDGKQ